MRKSISILVLISLTLVLNNCSKSEDAPTNSNSPYYSNDFGADVNSDFMGQVLDVQGNPIAGVTVTVGTATQTTDVRGFFLVNNAPVKERFAYIKATKPGYLEGSRSMVPLTGMNNLKIILLSDTPTATITSGAASEVALPNGAKVQFDGNFKTEAGATYTGSVKVSVNHLDPTDPATFDKMPGMLLGENKKGSLGVLESFGMLNVTLTGSNGEKLQPNTTANLEFPIAATQQSDAPNYIPLWHFDTTKGYWVEEGIATKTSGKYTGKVSHFSWWNCDVSSNSVTLKITVLDCNGKPMDNMAAELVRNAKNYGSRVGVTNNAGVVSGIVPGNETLVLNVYYAIKGCENQVLYSQQIRPLFEKNNELVITVPCTSTVKNVITQGTLTNCNDQKVTNGYVWMQLDTQYFYTPVTDGSFSFNVTSCSSGAFAMKVQGVDYDAKKESDIISQTVTGQNIDLGTLKTCADSQTTVTDIDGNVYPLVKIGAQTWMQKNLNVAHYRNGDPIPNVTDPTQWAYLTTGAWCYYENKTENGVVYGKLYNWYAVNDPRGLAPEGYHVPSDAEWTMLTTFLGGVGVAGGKMKEAGTAHWYTPNTGATNSSGFTGLPGGNRYGGIFNVIGYNGFWWSSSEGINTLAFYSHMNNSNGDLFKLEAVKNGGLSIRCVKD